MLDLNDVPESWGGHKLQLRRGYPGFVTIPSNWKDDSFLLLFPGTEPGPPVVRIHSRCAYGEVLGSLQCDCGPQLELSLRTLSTDGAGGVLAYLDQEGRGAGLSTKARAYAALETSGIDTFSFYNTVHGQSDLRDYELAAKALVEMGLQSIRLVTNNPEKVRAVENSGIETIRVDASTTIAPESTSYIQAKVGVGHLFPEHVFPKLLDKPRPGPTERLAAILFDFDDTVVHAGERRRESLLATMDRLGIKSDPSGFDRAYGEPFDRLVREIASEPLQSTDRFMQIYQDHVDMHPAPLHRGASIVLRRLFDAGLPIGIVSASDSNLVRSELRSHGIAEHFGLVWGTDAKPSKPDPATLDSAAQELGASSDETVVYVGDSLSDMDFANSAEVHFMAIATGDTTIEDFKKAGLAASQITDSWFDLWERLDSTFPNQLPRVSR